jgi:hypothetical protein
MPSERARAYFLVERWKEVYVTTGNIFPVTSPFELARACIPRSLISPRLCPDLQIY